MKRIKTAQFNNGRDVMGFFPTFIATNHDETEATTGKNAEVYYKISRNSGNVEITKIEVDGMKIDLSVIPSVYLQHFKQEAIEHNESRNRNQYEKD